MNDYPNFTIEMTIHPKEEENTEFSLVINDCRSSDLPKNDFNLSIDGGDYSILEEEREEEGYQKEVRILLFQNCFDEAIHVIAQQIKELKEKIKQQLLHKDELLVALVKALRLQATCYCNKRLINQAFKTLDEARQYYSQIESANKFLQMDVLIRLAYLHIQSDKLFPSKVTLNEFEALSVLLTRCLHKSGGDFHSNNNGKNHSSNNNQNTSIAFQTMSVFMAEMILLKAQMYLNDGCRNYQMCLELSEQAFSYLQFQKSPVCNNAIKEIVKRLSDQLYLLQGIAFQGLKMFEKAIASFDQTTSNIEECRIHSFSE